MSMAECAVRSHLADAWERAVEAYQKAVDLGLIASIEGDYPNFLAKVASTRKAMNEARLRLDVHEREHRCGLVEPSA